MVGCLDVSGVKFIHVNGLPPHGLSPYSSSPTSAALLIPLAKISNFTDREGNDVREA